MTDLPRLQTATWSELEIDPADIAIGPSALAGLPWLEQGIARFEYRRDRIILRTGPFAGQITIPGLCVIEIEELVTGTVEALLPFAVSGIRQAETQSGSSSTRVSPSSTLAARFSEGLYQHVQTGIDRQYASHIRDARMPRGHIDLAATVRRHRRRARPDVLTCRTRDLTDDTPVNRVLLSGAVRADPLLRDYPIYSSLEHLRRATNALRGVLLEPSPDLQTARAETHSSAREVTRDLVELAGLLIQGVPVIPTGAASGEVATSWVNVESIFEQAVRRATAEILPGKVAAGKGDGRRLLTGGHDIQADPDLVVHHDGTTVIADAKYRRHGADIDRSELYQLMSHAVAYQAGRAALVVPRLDVNDGDYFLGEDTRGCKYDVIVVNATLPSDITSRMRQWLGM